MRNHTNAGRDAARLRLFLLGGVIVFLCIAAVTALRFPGQFGWTRHGAAFLLMSSALAGYTYFALRRTKVETTEDAYVLPDGMKWGIAAGSVVSLSFIAINMIGHG